MTELVEIDGSYLEGGGQILRVSLALSALLKRPIRVSKIRAGRSSPGLREQHLKGVELVASISNGSKLKGAFIGSTEIEFWPGKINCGKYEANVQTAGSISLLLQVALPVLLFSNGKSQIILRGGTNVGMAPQIDYMTEVFRPVLELFGGSFDFDLIRRGYFPKGGGEVVIDVETINGNLTAVDLSERGNITDVYGYSFVAGRVPLNVAHQMTKGAINVLKNVFPQPQIETYKEVKEIAQDNASGLLLIAKTDRDITIGSSALGNRQEEPYKMGINTANKLVKTIQEGSSLDEYLQDQLIIFMALAKGKSLFKVGGEITKHTETAIFVVEQLTKVKFNIQRCESFSIVECDGMAFSSANC